MSMYQSDQYGEYRIMHSFIDVRPCHKGGHFCASREVRQYADGTLRVVSGPAIFSHSSKPEITAMMQIFSASQFALECATEAPK